MQAQCKIAWTDVTPSTPEFPRKVWRNMHKSATAAIQSHPRYAPPTALSQTEKAFLEHLKRGPTPTDELADALSVSNVSQVAYRFNTKMEAQGRPIRATCTLGAVLNRHGKRVRVGFWSIAGEA